MRSLLLPSGPAEPEPLPGREYLLTLHKYLKSNLARLAPAPSARLPSTPSILQQSYTLLTLGLDPSSQPLSTSLKIPLTLGFGQPSAPSPPRAAARPILLRLPPDRLLYLLLRWQSLPQALPHVGRTDVPIAPGVPVAARGARSDERAVKEEGDVRSVRSWVGSMRSVSMGSLATGGAMGRGWFGRKEEVNEDQILLALYSIFTVLPALLIHPPFLSDRPIAELVDAGGYTQLGGIDVRVPLDVLRNLQTLELEGYDPRGLLIPPNPGLRSLTVRAAQDADDWLEELLVVPYTDTENDSTRSADSSRPTNLRFPNLRHLALPSTSLLSFPSVPLSRLTSLDLSHNLLNSIPSSLSALHSLVSLNLSNNLITSVRNAPSVLGNITSLNLGANRIDCLAGLERVLGLERVDVRDNLLTEWDEVGRLAVLPHVKAVWCAGNPFDRDRSNDEWRVNLGVAFASEARGGDREEVVFDDRPFSWTETRRIEMDLASKGHLAHSRGYTTAAEPRVEGQGQYDSPRAYTQAQSHTPTHARVPANSPASTLGHAHVPASARGEHSRQTSAASSGPSMPPPSPASSVAVHKKRRPRRVINLDDTPEDEVVERSLRSPLIARRGGTEHSDGQKGTAHSEAQKGTAHSEAQKGTAHSEKQKGTAHSEEQKKGTSGAEQVRSGEDEGNVSMPERNAGRARVGASVVEPRNGAGVGQNSGG